MGLFFLFLFSFSPIGTKINLAEKNPPQEKKKRDGLIIDIYSDGVFCHTRFVPIPNHSFLLVPQEEEEAWRVRVRPRCLRALPCC
ncbi:hypothetical protein F4802DRAFT_559695, partial [Xylaria palmicola]